MKEQEAIDYLDNLQVGAFITVNILHVYIWVKMMKVDIS